MSWQGAHEVAVSWGHRELLSWQRTPEVANSSVAPISPISPAPLSVCSTLTSQMQVWWVGLGNGLWACPLCGKWLVKMLTAQIGFPFVFFQYSDDLKNSQQEARPSVLMYLWYGQDWADPQLRSSANGPIQWMLSACLLTPVCSFAFAMCVWPGFCSHMEGNRTVSMQSAQTVPRSSPHVSGWSCIFYNQRTMFFYLFCH